MVVKDEELGEVDDENLLRVKLISEKKRQLDEAADQVCQEIKSSFDRLTKALRAREKQLLRQVEAIHRQQLRLVQSDSELLPAVASSLVDADLQAEKQLIDELSSFGKIELLNSVSVDAEPFKVEEYQEAAKDHVSFDKSLKNEGEEFNVSSVIRRTKRDSYNINPAKPISINLNCASCESCKYETSSASAFTTAQIKLDQSLSAPLTSASTSSSISSGEKSVKENEDDIPTSAESEPSSANTKSAHSENFYFETESSKSSNSSTSRPIIVSEESGDETDAANKSSKEKAKNSAEQHPIQIQQWLQQILAETETEPIIHEIGQFSKIPNTQLYHEFSVET